MSSASNPIRRNAALSINPIAGAIGAEVDGFDLNQRVNDATFETIRAAFLVHQVLVIRGKAPVGSEPIIAFMRRFGEPDADPFAGSFRLPNIDGNPYVFGFVKEAQDRKINLGGFWHADVTCRQRPHKAGLLYCAEAPSAGGDTMFSNQYLAFETLSAGMRAMLEGIRAVHSSTMDYGRESARFAEVSRDHAPTIEDASFSSDTYDANANPDIEEYIHPVVRLHPDTGRKYLFVNRAFTTRFENMSHEESLPLLEVLWNHAVRPEFTCRVRWRKYTSVVWDNRCAQHYAINDYFGERREMHRVAVHD